MDRKLLVDVIADLEALTTLEDAVLFRSLYLKALRGVAALPQAEGRAIGGVTVRVELEGLGNLEVEPGILKGTGLAESLVGTCTGLATAGFLAVIIGLQTGRQGLIGLPAKVVREISQKTLEAME